jgi:peptidoglycan L-alanyl-D-glutamate endopeptidase CwlK
MLAERSIKALAGVHPDLVAIVHRADELGARFHVTEGMRTLERQRSLLKAGKSKTLKSRHLTGHAVDFVAVTDDGAVSYAAEPMRRVADAFKAAAHELGHPIVWGGDWRTFKDTPHVELSRKAYPADKPNVPSLNPENKPESAPIPQESMPIPAPVPAAPLRKSGTVWGTITGALAAAVAYMETAAASLIEWAAKLAELGPVSAALATMGGNVKSLSLGLGIGAAVFVISRRWRAYLEGKPG